MTNEDDFSRMGLQHFAEAAAEETVVEEEKPEEEQEIVVLEEGQLPPSEDETPEELKGMSPRQILEKIRSLEAAAVKSGDSSQALRDGIAALGEKLQPAPAPAAAPVQEPGESDEAFRARFSKKLFEDGNSPFDAVEELIERRGTKKIMKELAPLLQTLIDQAVKSAELNVLNDPQDGPIFKKFEKEIRGKIARLPPEQQKNPQVWKYMTDQAKVEHFGELVAEGGGKSEQAAERPAEQRRGAAPVFFQESGGGGGAGRSAGPRKVYVTEQMKREAMELGMPIEEFAKRTGKAGGK